MKNDDKSKIRDQASKIEGDMLRLISTEVPLMSLLYDINMLPEQIDKIQENAKWHHMLMMCAFYSLGKDSVQKANAPAEARSSLQPDVGTQKGDA